MIAAVVALLLQRYVVLLGVPVRVAVAVPLLLPQVVATDDVVKAVAVDGDTDTADDAVHPPLVTVTV